MIVFVQISYLHESNVCQDNPVLWIYYEAVRTFIVGIFMSKPFSSDASLVFQRKPFNIAGVNICVVRASDCQPNLVNDPVMQDNACEWKHVAYGSFLWNCEPRKVVHLFKFEFIMWPIYGCLNWLMHCNTVLRVKNFFIVLCHLCEVFWFSILWGNSASATQKQCANA